MQSVEQALRKVPLVSGLTEADLHQLVPHVEVREYEAGSLVVKQDDPGAVLYLVLAGQLRVVRRGRTGRTMRLAELGPGEFFGEMAILEGRPRSADVVATTPTTCALLSREVFFESLLGNREVAARLLGALSHKLRALNELVERPGVATPAPPRERERRILLNGETTMASDIRNALVIKEGNHFTLFDQTGTIPLGNTGGFGLYLGDTRHLSGYEVSLGRVQAVALLSTAHLGYAADQQLTNRDIRQGRRIIRKETLLIGRAWVAQESGFDEQIAVTNFNPFPISLALQLRFSADFADIFEVRGVGRPRRGAHLPARVAADSVTLAYRGLDDRTYETRLHFEPDPAQVRANHITYRLQVPALGYRRLSVQVSAAVRSTDDQPSGRPRARQDRATQSESVGGVGTYEDWLQRSTVLTTDNPVFDAAIRRSLLDLRMLVNHSEDQRFFAAGIPWFAALFGRDSIITGLQTLAWNPDLAAGVLRLLAQHQGTRDDPWRDEEPGKILHEVRSGELARLNQIPHTPYYGSVDTTPLFLMLAAAYHDWTGDRALLRDLQPNLEAALGWCVDWGDLDGDGYVEYTRRSAKGLVNQGWRDSGDGIMFQTGKLPRPPIALVEVQAYLYAAYRDTARLLRRLGPDHEPRSRELEQRAAELSERFDRDFWMPAERYYALGLDGGKRQIDAVTSNPGHALWTGIVDPRRAAPVAQRLLSDELFSGWGIRTLSQHAGSYNPLGYHLGTVWPHDNAIILAGLRRYGFDAEASTLFTALFDAAEQFAYFRLPELFSGISRTTYGVPVGYPVACSPQAWAAGALPFMLSHLLGLRPRRGGTALEVVRPILPSCVNVLHLRGLRVGQARVDLTFQRGAQPGGPVRVAVDRQDGPLDICQAPAAAS